MLPDKISFTDEERYIFFDPVILRVIGNTDDISIDNYKLQIDRLTDDQIREIAVELFIDQYERNGRIIPRFHPNLIPFVISNNINKDTFKSWLSNSIPLDSKNIVLAMKKFLITRYFYNFPQYTQGINTVNSALSILNIRETRVIMSVDGDNVTTSLIPVYKNIIKNDNIIFLCYYSIGVIPSYVEAFQKLNNTDKIKIGLSYGSKKDAADIATTFVQTELVKWAINNDKNIGFALLTNDKYAIEVTELSKALNKDLSTYNSDIRKFVWIDPYEYENDYKLSVWKYQNILSDAIDIFGNFINSLRERDEPINISYSDWFIRFIKANHWILPIPYYEVIFELVREYESFENIYQVVLQSNYSDFEKVDIISQYFVLTGSKFFTYYELRKLLQSQYNYIQKFKNYIQFESLQLSELEDFLSIDINKNVSNIYNVYNMTDFLINYIEDLKIALDIKDVKHIDNVIQYIII